MFTQTHLKGGSFRGVGQIHPRLRAATKQIFGRFDLSLWHSGFLPTPTLANYSQNGGGEMFTSRIRYFNDIGGHTPHEAQQDASGRKERVKESAPVAGSFTDADATQDRPD